MNVHSEHLSDPGIELRESLKQAKTVDAEKVGSVEPKWPKPLPFNRNLVFLEIRIGRPREERRSVE